MMAKTITARCEDYLKSIYRLQKERKVVRVKDLATVMEVKAPTVVGILSGLKDQGLVHQEPYGYLVLSADGEMLAEELLEKERLLRDFFAAVLRMEPDEAERNSCAIEHYVTPEGYERFQVFLRFLNQCVESRARWVSHFHHFLETVEMSYCCLGEGMKCGTCAGAVDCSDQTREDMGDSH